MKHLLEAIVRAKRRRQRFSYPHLQSAVLSFALATTFALGGKEFFQVVRHFL